MNNPFQIKIPDEIKDIVIFGKGELNIGYAPGLQFVDHKYSVRMWIKIKLWKENGVVKSFCWPASEETQEEFFKKVLEDLDK